MKEASKPKFFVIPIIVFVLLLVITIIFFFTFTNPEVRRLYFYINLFVICAAEFVVFAWFVNRSISQEKAERTSTPTYLTIYYIIVLWFAITVFFVFISLVTQFKFTLFQGLLVFIYSIITLVLLFGSSIFYQQDRAFVKDFITAQKEKIKYVRKEITMSQLRSQLSDLSKVFPDRLIEIDRIGKRMESLELKFRHFTSSQSSKDVGSSSSDIQHIEKNILEEIISLGNLIESAQEEKAVPKLDEIKNKLSSIENLIAQREKLLL